MSLLLLLLMLRYNGFTTMNSNTCLGNENDKSFNLVYCVVEYPNILLHTVYWMYLLISIRYIHSYLVDEMNAIGQGICATIGGNTLVCFIIY